MKWLLLYGKEGQSDSIKVGEYFKENNINFAFVEHIEEHARIDNDEKLFEMMTKLTDILKDVTHIVCINIHEIPLRGIYLYALGLIANSNISIFHTGRRPNLPENLSNNFFDSSVDIKQLFENLDIHFPEFIKREAEQIAKKELLDRNIPCSTDVLAQSVIDENLEICELLVNAGVSVDSVDRDGTPMLCIAARNGNMTMLKWLVGKNANINAISEDRGYTPLMDAVWKNKQELVEYLVSIGADLSPISKDGQPIAVLASGVGNTDICKLLAEKGADSNIKDAMGMSAFDYATLFQNKRLLDVYNTVAK